MMSLSLRYMDLLLTRETCKKGTGELGTTTSQFPGTDEIGYSNIGWNLSSAENANFNFTILFPLGLCLAASDRTYTQNRHADQCDTLADQVSLNRHCARLT